MNTSQSFALERSTLRQTLLQSSRAAAEAHGATELHVHGSMGRGTADAFSDLDLWLTFPDDRIEAAIAGRSGLYGAIGPILLTHEAAANRPIGGIYTLVLYDTDGGPMIIDWSLAPQHTSHVPPVAIVIYEHISVPRGVPRQDLEAVQPVSRPERISWLICMLFAVIKVVARGDDGGFPAFLEQAYRDIGTTYNMTGFRVTSPTSSGDIAAMAHQLRPFSNAGQASAITAIERFLACLHIEIEPSTIPLLAPRP